MSALVNALTPNRFSVPFRLALYTYTLITPLLRSDIPYSCKGPLPEHLLNLVLLVEVRNQAKSAQLLLPLLVQDLVLGKHGVGLRKFDEAEPIELLVLSDLPEEFDEVQRHGSLYLLPFVLE